MKLKTWMAVSLGLALMPLALHADVAVAAAATQAGVPLDLSNLISFLHPFFALLLGALLSTEGHALLEVLVSFVPNPFVRIAAKLALGSVGATATAIFGAKFGVTTADATAAWVGVLGFLPTIKVVVAQLKALGLTTDIKADVAKVGAAALTPTGLADIAHLARISGHPMLATFITQDADGLGLAGASLPSTQVAGQPLDAAVRVLTQLGHTQAASILQQAVPQVAAPLPAAPAPVPAPAPAPQSVPVDELVPAKAAPAATDPAQAAAPTPAPPGA